MKPDFIGNWKQAARQHYGRMPYAHRTRLWAAPLITAAAAATTVYCVKAGMAQIAALPATAAVVGATMTAGSYANVSPMGWARVTGIVALEFAVSAAYCLYSGSNSMAAIIGINAPNFAAIAWAKAREARKLEKSNGPRSFRPLIYQSLEFSPTIPALKFVRQSVRTASAMVAKR